MGLSDIKLEQYPLPDDQFIKTKTKKTQIYLHHTVSGLNSARKVRDYFNSNPERVAVQICLDGDGTAVQLYSTDYWGYHLGLEQHIFNKFKVPFKWLDKISIGVEVCAYGRLIYDKKKFYSVYGNLVPNDQVFTFDKPFRNALHYQKYTQEQIDTLHKLLLYWKEKWGIPLTYNEDIWDLCPRALKGEPGIYTHCSVRPDKSDIYPYPPMVEMLKSL